MGSLGYEFAEANSWERYCELRQARSGVDHREVAEGFGRPLRIGWFTSTCCGPVASRCKPSDAWAAVEVPTKGVDFPEAEVGHERCMVRGGEGEICLHIQAERFADDRLA